MPRQLNLKLIERQSLEPFDPVLMPRGIHPGVQRQTWRRGREWRRLRPRRFASAIVRPSERAVKVRRG